MENRDLLEDVKQMVKCMVISDLPYMEPKAMWEALQTLQPSTYKTSQWEEATNYLLRKQLHFQNSEEAKQYLCQAYAKMMQEDVNTKKQ